MEPAFGPALGFSVRAFLSRPCLRTQLGAISVSTRQNPSSSAIRRAQKRYKVYIASGQEQAKPLEGFYADILSNPTRSAAPATRARPAPPPTDSPPKTQKEETLSKARIVFGTRLAGPGERRADIDSRSARIAGVLVPPRPTEPDNCCMSGCVNCVWDMYRDELEEWAAKSAEARAKLHAQEGGTRAGAGPKRSDAVAHAAVSMDDDGGGSETNWNLDTGGKDLFEGIPVGIRQFMMTEKMLKQRHEKEDSVGR